MITLRKNGDKKLLDLIRDQGANHYTECESGFCGACRTTLIDGQVNHFNDLGYRGENEVLPCCSIPATETVTLNLNTNA